MMSDAILVIGESGSGKSTSLRNLPPEETYIINVIDKSLPFKGWSKKYNVDKKNYFASTDAGKIVRCMHAVSERLPNIKTLIVDDWQYIMSYLYMAKTYEDNRGDAVFKKYNEIQERGFIVMQQAKELRKDLTVIILAHSEQDIRGFHKLMTMGKILDEKIKLPGMFTLILHAMKIEDRYVFQTQISDYYLAKSPMGMFEEEYIDNDLVLVKKSIEEYKE